MSRTEASPRAQIWRRHWSSKRERSGSEPGMDRGPPNATIVARQYATFVTDRQGLLGCCHAIGRAPSESCYAPSTAVDPAERDDDNAFLRWKPPAGGFRGKAASGHHRILSFLHLSCDQRPSGPHWGSLIRHVERGGSDRGLEAHPGGRGRDHAHGRSRTSRSGCADPQVIGAGRPRALRQAPTWTLPPAG